MAVPSVLHSSPVIRRHPKNPVLTREVVPYRSSLVFNAGVTKYQGRYIMMFRNDSGEVKIYYGAADTVECVATAHVDDLLALCRPVSGLGAE